MFFFRARKRARERGDDWEPEEDMGTDSEPDSLPVATDSEEEQVDSSEDDEY